MYTVNTVCKLLRLNVVIAIDRSYEDMLGDKIAKDQTFETDQAVCRRLNRSYDEYRCASYRNEHTHTHTEVTLQGLLVNRPTARRAHLPHRTTNHMYTIHRRRHSKRHYV